MLKFAERIDDCDELSCDSDDDDFIGFSGGTQAIGEGFQNRVVMAGNEGRLELSYPPKFGH